MRRLALPTIVPLSQALGSLPIVEISFITLPFSHPFPEGDSSKLSPKV